MAFLYGLSDPDGQDLGQEFPGSWPVIQGIEIEAYTDLQG